MTLNEFANTYEEIHAIWYGFSDSLTWARHPSEDAPRECRDEPHYYRLGWLAGKILQAGIYLALGALLMKVVCVC